jgi:hypothetical protein
MFHISKSHVVDRKVDGTDNGPIEQTADPAAGEGATARNSTENQIDRRAGDDLMEWWRIECSQEQVVAEIGRDQREYAVVCDFRPF